MSSAARRQQAPRAGGEGGSSSRRRADGGGGTSDSRSRSKKGGGQSKDGDGGGGGGNGEVLFHYLNWQKRLLRGYAKVHLGLGTRWRSSLPRIVSVKGTRLDETPSSQWTQVGGWVGGLQSGVVVCR